MEIRAAKPHEWPRAAERLFAEALRRSEFLARLRSGTIDPNGLLIAEDGAILVEFFPGRIAEFTPPWAESPTRAEELVEAGLQLCRDRGVVLAQLVLESREKYDNYPHFTRCGFRYATNILTMVAEVNACETDPRLTFERYTPSLREEFARTLRRTHEGSLDLPEASVIDGESDLLDRYFFGQTEPLAWWLVRAQNEEPIGVLLLGSKAPLATSEILYFGVVFSARRNGYGAAILGEAMRKSPEIGAVELRLTVDKRNIPARKLYGRFGFRAIAEQAVFLRTFET